MNHLDKMARRSRTQYASKSRSAPRKKRRVQSIPRAPQNKSLQMLASQRIPGQLYARGQHVLMRYSEAVDLDSTVSGISTYQYRMNNIYDPNYTGVGHQPISHDQWAALYKNYIVYGFSAQVHFGVQHTAASGNGTMTVGIVPNMTSAMPLTDQDTFLEYSNSKSKILGTIDGAGCATFNTGYINIADLAGMKGVVTDASQWGAAFGANPSNEAFLTLFALNDDGVTGNVNARVLLNYYCWIYEPADLSES